MCTCVHMDENMPVYIIFCMSVCAYIICYKTIVWSIIICDNFWRLQTRLSSIELKLLVLVQWTSWQSKAREFLFAIEVDHV